MEARDSPAKGHALRASINTPIQGGAADVVTAAMLQIGRSQREGRLKELGYRLLMQVHDEVILEGPRELADEATARVVGLMERPFWGTNPLRVELAVDAKHADNWYEAK
jgi:DNA polymerase-1